MKCRLCDQRKAKRNCPAKNALICAQCCGEKRIFEIDCPDSCPYLKAGREREIEDYGKRLRNLDANAQVRNRRILQESQDAIVRLEYALSQERLMSHDLTDKDVVQAVDVLLETYKTEDKGVLYEKTSEDLRVEPLRRELRKIIESLRNPEGTEAKGLVDPQSTRLSLSAAIDCLEYIRSIASAYLQDRRSISSYIDFLARVIPRKETRSSIIMP
jgi:hypothetical protein